MFAPACARASKENGDERRVRANARQAARLANGQQFGSNLVHAIAAATTTTMTTTTTAAVVAVAAAAATVTAACAVARTRSVYEANYLDNKLHVARSAVGGRRASCVVVVVVVGVRTWRPVVEAAVADGRLA